MADIQVVLQSYIADTVETQGSPIYAYLGSNPGVTEAQIQTGTSIGAAVLEFVLKIMVNSGIVQRRQDTEGTEFYWRATDWATLILQNAAAARTWVAANNNGFVSAMAVAIGVHEAVAVALSQVMELERRITRVTSGP